MTSGMIQTATILVENLLNMCERLGFVPNGARKYYLNRSQPPFATLMVDTIYKTTRNDTRLRQCSSISSICFYTIYVLQSLCCGNIIALLLLFMFIQATSLNCL